MENTRLTQIIAEEVERSLQLQELRTIHEANFVDQFLDFNQDNVNFYNAVEKLKSKDMNKRFLQKLAKKFNVDPKDALRFVKEMWITKLEAKKNNSNLIEASSKKVTKQMWKKMDEDERESALLTVIEDPDDIGPQIEDDWKDLPGWMRRDMRTEGKLTEAKKIKPHDLGYRIPNIKRAINHFKQGDSIAASSKSGKGTFRIDKEGDFKKYPTNDWEFAYIKEGKLNEAKDTKLAKLFQQSLKASVKDGEDKLYKLSQAWESWNVDNDDKYDDLVDPLFAAIELVQDAGEPGKNNVVKDKEYYSYIKSADKHLKQFNKDCKKALKGLKEGKLNEVRVKKGDIIQMQDGEYGVVNKLKGRVAYIKLDSNPGSFQPIEAARITYKGKHKGKDLYSESKLNEATAKDTLKNAVNALTKTFGGKKLNSSKTKQYLKRIEQIARKNPGLFVSQYSGYDVKDWIDSVNEGKVNEEDYKYKKYVSKAFDKINDEMFDFRHSMGIKQLTNKDQKLKRKFEALQANIFALQREMKSKGLTEGMLNEMDINDPILVAIRARKTMLAKNAKIRIPTEKQYYKLMDAEIDLINQIKDARRELEQLDSDMNQDAGQKGDEWTDDDANRYGGDLDKLQTKVEKLVKRKLGIKKAIMTYRIN